MPNNYTDLWSQITFLWPNKQVLGDRLEYRYRCEDENEIPKIRKATLPFFFRVSKSKLNLPPVKFNKHICKLKPYQAKIYHAISIKFLREIKLQPDVRESLRQWRKSKMVRLIQVASNPTLLSLNSEEFDIPALSTEDIPFIKLIDRYPQFEVPAKFELAIKLINNLLNQGEKVIVWTSFVHNIKMLKKLLHNVKTFEVYGAVPKDENEDIEYNREQQIRHFKTSRQPSILLANPAACAESISLHKACHHAIYLDRTFNCGQYMQSLDRIHRIGLEPNEIVTYHILLAKDTIDVTIDRRLIEKQENMSKLLEDDLPLGTFETEKQQMVQTENEEEVDFVETLKELKKQFGSAPVVEK